MDPCNSVSKDMVSGKCGAGTGKNCPLVQPEHVAYEVQGWGKAREGQISQDLEAKDFNP